MSQQLVIACTVDVSKEVDGIEMGVLSDGTAYLTGRGVARLCGASDSTIRNQRDEWSAGKRNNRLAKMLQAQGYDEKELFIPISDAHAYPESVCMALLEYFAFEAQTPSKIAEANYRRLARAGLRIFVYTALGYARPALVPPDWQRFHDRMLMVSAPFGYFSVFKEIADFVLASIRCGLRVNEQNVPDISVGKLWAAHWVKNEFDKQYGERVSHAHNYPDYFPQSASNPQPMWVYPIQALGEFRLWLHRDYVPQCFPKYLEGKVKKGVLAASTAEMLVEHATPPQLAAKP